LHSEDATSLKEVVQHVDDNEDRSHAFASRRVPNERS
jgi:hypothetical protein